MTKFLSSGPANVPDFRQAPHVALYEAEALEDSLFGRLNPAESACRKAFREQRSVPLLMNYSHKGFPMRAVIACVVAALTLSACGGRSAACTKAVSCGTAITAVGAASAETAVKNCETNGGNFVDTCCSALTAGYTVAAGSDVPAACQ
jgi:hypothetical protein